MELVQLFNDTANVLILVLAVLFFFTLEHRCTDKNGKDQSTPACIV